LHRRHRYGADNITIEKAQCFAFFVQRKNIQQWKVMLWSGYRQSSLRAQMIERGQFVVPARGNPLLYLGIEVSGPVCGRGVSEIEPASGS